MQGWLMDRGHQLVLPASLCPQLTLWLGLAWQPIQSSYQPACQCGTECSDTSAYKIQMPGNYPEESIQHSEHGKSLKSRN